MIKLVFFVPASHLESVKASVFATGAGRVGAYSNCCWQVSGSGQFLPLPGSTPFLGDSGRLEQVEEYRVELVCADAVALDAVDALISAHPYEEPAYETYPVYDREGLSRLLASGPAGQVVDSSE